MAMVSLEAAIAALTIAASLLPYLNTLPAGFAFDDNFAVVRHAGAATARLGRCSAHA
jgi:hypothetical protein